MSLEKIRKKIADDAQNEAKKFIHESQKKAEEIKEKSLQEAIQLAEALQKEAERKGNLEASRLITQARLEKKINILKHRKDLIDEVIEKAFQKAGVTDKDLKKKLILKDGEKEEFFEQEKLKEELRPKLENYIAEVLKI
ncbi:V-type ATP synthase subunit E family protein [Acidobacteriota bacterium]